MKLMLHRKLVVATAFATLVGGASSANVFIGDLVYCDVGGTRGAYDPDQGDYGINGVEVDIHCTNTAGATCDVTTTTGAYHASVDPATFNSTCSAFSTFDVQDPAALTGRYAVNITRPEACPASVLTLPLTCTATVNPATLPTTCNALVTPSVSTPVLPADGNGDGDFCDAEDGPFVEGQILGDNGVDQATCEANGAAPPANGSHETIIEQPLAQNHCALYDDFGYEKNQPTCTPCVPRTHTCHKGISSWSSLFVNQHPGVPTCPYGVGTDPNKVYTSTTWNQPPVTYCPVDDTDPDDYDGSHHPNHHHHKEWSFGPISWSSWGWGWH